MVAANFNFLPIKLNFAAETIQGQKLNEEIISYVYVQNFYE